MQLLDTKFYIPGYADPNHTVVRTALIRKLNTVLDGAIALVRAPAGFGKTTLLSQWIFHQQMYSKVCWVSLDKADNHVNRFWGYIFESFARRFSGLCKNAIIQLRSPDDFSIEDTLITMMNDIGAAQQKFILVLDDFHLIRNPDILNSFNFFVDHPLSNLLIVISTREKPDLELSRIRVSGRLLELDKSELKFSEPEAAAFFSLRKDTSLSRVRQKQVFERSEGWVAALKLTLLSEKNNITGNSSPITGNTRFIREYLFEEVFNGLPDPLKVFLLSICVLNRFNTSLCKAITHDPHTPVHLDFLLQNQFFIIPLDDTAHWYRFHHLFLDFLRNILSGHKCIREAELHHRAFGWFQENNYFEEAFSHALSGGREDLAAGIFAEQISSLYGDGSEEMVKPFFDRLNEKTILANPVLAGYHLGFRIYAGNFGTLKKMRHLLANTFSKKEHRIFKGFLTTSEAYEMFYVAGDLEKAIVLCEEAMLLLPDTHAAIHRMLENIQTASYRFSGQVEPAVRLCRPRKEDGLLMAAFTAANRADLDIELGRLTAAFDAVTEQIQRIDSVFGRHTPQPIYGFLYIMKGKILRERNRLKESLECFSKGMNIVKTAGFVELVVISYAEYSMLLASCNEFDMAHEAVDRAIRIANSNFSWLENIMLAQKNRFRIMENKPDLAAPWARSHPVYKNMDIPFIRTMEYLVLVHYYIACKEFEKAHFILEPIIRKDINDNRNTRLIECYTLLAEIMAAGDDMDGACRMLENAFELSRNEGHAIVFVEAFSKIKDAFLKCRQRKTLPPYLEKHLGFASPSQSRPDAKKIAVHDYIEKFNTREMDLLRLFKEGLSNKEAADRLCLSVNTVRWYASRLFAKLDVKRRGQAVSKAETLQLI